MTTRSKKERAPAAMQIRIKLDPHMAGVYEYMAKLPPRLRAREAVSLLRLAHAIRYCNLPIGLPAPAAAALGQAPGVPLPPVAPGTGAPNATVLDSTVPSAAVAIEPWFTLTSTRP